MKLDSRFFIYLIDLRIHSNGYRVIVVLNFVLSVTHAIAECII